MLRSLDTRKINLVIALTGTIGSLYFSEIMKFVPCTLCWYQRLFLYPLVLIYLVALWTDDHIYRKYVLMFIVFGCAFSVYHCLLYYGFISTAIIPCTQGVSCTSKQLELFGFITIPLLSAMAFITMGCLELFTLKKGSTL